MSMFTFSIILIAVFMLILIFKKDDGLIDLMCFIGLIISMAMLYQSKDCSKVKKEVTMKVDKDGFYYSKPIK